MKGVCCRRVILRVCERKAVWPEQVKNAKGNPADPCSAGQSVMWGVSISGIKGYENSGFLFTLGAPLNN
jgi:hypothetical protein